MRMPKKLKAKWLKALRSGEYGQAKGTLTDGKGNFCCLGVLQHVASGGSCEAWDHAEGNFKSLPSSEWYSKNGIHDHWREQSQLADMNDGTGETWNTVKQTYTKHRQKSFQQIANWIEKNVEGY